MGSSKAIRSAADLLSCLPPAELEQVLLRLPAERARSIRQCLQQGEPDALQRRRVAQRFIRELRRTGSETIDYRIDPPHTVPATHHMSRLLASQLAAALTHESPRTIACALSLLPAGKAADMLTLLPEEQQSQVVQEMSTLGPISPEVQQDLASAIVDLASRACVDNAIVPPARERLAAVLCCTDLPTRQRLVQSLRQAGIDWDDCVVPVAADP